MLLRVWRTAFDRDRLGELVEFAHVVSAPMFQSLDGCAGYIYAHLDDQWITYTIWESEEVIAVAEASPSYRRVVERLLETDLLRGEQTTEVFEIAADVRFD